MLRDGKAYSTLFWAAFLGFVVVPVLALAIDAGRYFYAKQEIGKAADAAALAAAAQIDWAVYRDTGDLQPTGETVMFAQAYVNANTDYLSSRGIQAAISGLEMDAANDTVRVAVSADVSALFPSVMPQVVLTEWGEAQVRPRTRP